MLHDVQGYKHHEIASLLDISPGTSKAQLHRARMMLRRHLRPASGNARKRLMTLTRSPTACRIYLDGELARTSAPRRAHLAVRRVPRDARDLRGWPRGPALAGGRGRPRQTCGPAIAAALDPRTAPGAPLPAPVPSATRRRVSFTLPQLAAAASR